VLGQVASLFDGDDLGALLGQHERRRLHQRQDGTLVKAWMVRCGRLAANNGAIGPASMWAMIAACSEPTWSRTASSSSAYLPWGQGVQEHRVGGRRPASVEQDQPREGRQRSEAQGDPRVFPGDVDMAEAPEAHYQVGRSFAEDLVAGRAGQPPARSNSW
jgi:hypothetical protein